MDDCLAIQLPSPFLPGYKLSHPLSFLLLHPLASWLKRLLMALAFILPCPCVPFLRLLLPLIIS